MNAHEAKASTFDSHWQAPTIEIVYGKSLSQKSDHTLENTQAGGLLAEEYPAAQATSPPRQVQNCLTPFDLADEDLVQARILQQAYESQRPAPSFGDHNTMTKDPDPPENPHTTSTVPRESVSSQLGVIEKQAPSEAMPPQSPKGTTLQHEEPEDDRGSLLSEDPEDEDADPEWLS